MTLAYVPNLTSHAPHMLLCNPCHTHTLCLTTVRPGQLHSGRSRFGSTQMLRMTCHGHLCPHRSVAPPNCLLVRCLGRKCRQQVVDFRPEAALVGKIVNGSSQGCCILIAIQGVAKQPRSTSAKETSPPMRACLSKKSRLAQLWPLCSALHSCKDGAWASRYQCTYCGSRRISISPPMGSGIQPAGEA